MVTFVINYNSDTLSLPKSATTLYMPANAETAESNFSSGLCCRRHTARAEAYFPHGEFSHTLSKHSHRGETYSFTGVERIVPGGWNTQFHGDETHSLSERYLVFSHRAVLRDRFGVPFVSDICRLLMSGRSALPPFGSKADARL